MKPKRRRKKKLVHQNHELAAILKEDHRRLKIRVVQGEKIKLRRTRSRSKADDALLRRKQNEGNEE